MILISLFLLVSPPSQADVVRYTILPGDTLWSISARYLGDGSKWYIIYEANRDVIKNPNLIFPSTIIYIPLPQNQNTNLTLESDTTSFFSQEGESIKDLADYEVSKNKEESDFIEIEKRLSDDFPFSQTSFDITSKRFRVDKKYVIGEVESGDKLLKVGDYIEFKADFTCQQGGSVGIFKKVFESDDYIDCDFVGVCMVRLCKDGFYSCLITSSNREIRTGDLIVRWKKRN